MPFAESIVEEAALAWLDLGYSIFHGPDIALVSPQGLLRSSNRSDMVIL